MNFLISANTDVGIRKSINQDCLSVKKIQTPLEEMVFALLCDGMGGLSKGEVASANVIRAFSEWVNDILPQIYHNIDALLIKEHWEGIIKTQNRMLMEYSQKENIKMGTTATIMLLTYKNYYIMNIGDTRAYFIRDNILQITQDHTLVAKELNKGTLTEEQAVNDPRKNILIQCIGVSEQIFPDFFTGETQKDSVYMICSDGFRNKISTNEIYELLNPQVLVDTKVMKNNIDTLIQLNKERKETDNISAIAVRTY